MDDYGIPSFTCKQSRGIARHQALYEVTAGSMTSASGGSRGGRLGQLPRAPREGAPKRESKNNAKLHDEKRD